MSRAIAPDRSLGERLSALEAWAESHERICGSRWGLLIAVMLALFTAGLGAGGWAFAQVWASQQQQLEALREATSENY